MLFQYGAAEILVISDVGKVQKITVQILCGSSLCSLTHFHFVQVREKGFEFKTSRFYIPLQLSFYTLMKVIIQFKSYAGVHYVPSRTFTSFKCGRKDSNLRRH